MGISSLSLGSLDTQSLLSMAKEFPLLGASALVKVPQILNILGQGNVEGLSPLTHYADTMVHTERVATGLA